MKEVTLSAARIINGAVRYPVEGPIPVSDEEYDRLVEAGAIEEPEDEDEDEDAEADDEDGLESLKLDELKTLAAEEQIDLGDATKKADIIEAIRVGRATAA